MDAPLVPLTPVSLAGLVPGLPAPDVTCEPAVQRACAALCDRLVAPGVSLRPTPVAGWSPGRLRHAGLLVAEAEAGHLIRADLDAGGSGFSDSFRAMVAFGRTAPGSKVAGACHQIALMGPAVRAALAGVAALMMPTAPGRAFRHGAPVPVDQADFTALASAAGLPAVSFPLPGPGGGPPLAAQLVGPEFSDARLIAMAQALSHA